MERRVSNKSKLFNTRFSVKAVFPHPEGPTTRMLAGVRNRNGSLHIFQPLNDNSFERSTLFIDTVDDNNSYKLYSKRLRRESTFSTFALLYDHSQRNHAWKTGSRNLAKNVRVLSLSNVSKHNAHDCGLAQLGETSHLSPRTSNTSRSNRSRVAPHSFPREAHSCPSLRTHYCKSTCTVPTNAYRVDHEDPCSRCNRMANDWVAWVKRSQGTVP